MMAFLLIGTVLGFEEEVRDKLLEHEEVKETYTVCGVYDIVVKLEAEDTAQVKAAVDKMRRMKEISSTLTMFVMETDA